MENVITTVIVNSECGINPKTLCLSRSRAKEMSMVEDQCSSDNCHVHVVTDCLACCICYLTESMVDVGAI